MAFQAPPSLPVIASPGWASSSPHEVLTFGQRSKTSLVINSTFPSRNLGTGKHLGAHSHWGTLENWRQLRSLNVLRQSAHFPSTPKISMQIDTYYLAKQHASISLVSPAVILVKSTNRLRFTPIYKLCTRTACHLAQSNKKDKRTTTAPTKPLAPRPLFRSSPVDAVRSLHQQHDLSPSPPLRRIRLWMI